MSRLLIDTNILLLYVVGRRDRAIIPRFKRTSLFDGDDFDMLLHQVGQYSALLVTGGVLAEVSNLLPDYLHVDLAAELRGLVAQAQEAVAPATEIVGQNVFPRLGYTDCGILVAATMGETTVLTDDVQLYLTLMAREQRVVNFNHLRRLRD